MTATATESSLIGTTKEVARASSGIKTLDDALKAVAEVGPVAREYCQKAEDARQLPVEVVDAIDAAGLWTAFAPTEVGGAGLMGLTEQFEILRAMAYEDTSAGWAVFICGTGIGLIGSCLSAEGRAEVFEHGIAPGAGVFNPGGSARVTPEGLRVSGKWPFASGITYARWVLANTIVLDETGAPRPGVGGLPELRSVIVPQEQVTIVDDWHVAGLRGTGSMSFTMDDVLVPEHRTAPFFSPPAIDDLKYRVPLFSLVSPSFAGQAVGIAERALDEITALLPTKVGPPTFTPASQDPVTQNTVGQVIAAIRAARESTRAIYAKYDSRVAAGEDLAGLPAVERGEIHQHTVWAANTCRDAVNELFRLGGASSIYEPGTLQRTWRDINVLNQHLFLRTINHEHVAKLALGIEYDSPFL